MEKPRIGKCYPDSHKISPVVFINYANEGNLGEKIHKLAKWLTDNVIQIITDHLYQNRPPVKGWREWEDADNDETALANLWGIIALFEQSVCD